VDDRSLIEEQIHYYRARAPEYDETASPPDVPLVAYGERIEAALRDFRPEGRVLEIASGTGAWTRHLLQHASAVTAVDSSPEMHDIARGKIGHDPRIQHVVADIFQWVSSERYDVVFFANWLSHVPPSRFEGFWALVEAALAPVGRVFFIDEARDAWRHEALREEFVQDAAVSLVRRSLRQGMTFNVVKVFWDAGELKARLAPLGWDIEIHMTGPLFWGQGRRVE
jgi:SAM-dependent methyltransferase